MKNNRWLALLGTAVVIGSVALAGIPAAKAMAAGGPPAGAGGQAVQNVERGGYGMGLGRINGGMASAVAKYLGIDISSLIAERHAGKSMVQIAEDNGKTEQELVDYVAGQRSEQIDQLVTGGKITQEQADQHKQFMTERVKANLNRTSVGPNRPDGAGRGAYGQGSKGAGKGMGAGFGARAGFCPYYNQVQ